MRFIEFTDEDKKRRVAHIQAMVDAVQKYCEVVPAYGPEVIPPGFEAAEDVLEDEEHSALLLAAERSATLFTLDGRLAQLAAGSLGLKRVWPQAVIRHAGETGQIRPSDYSFASIRQFLGNRTFVSLGPYDLVFMCLQGGYTLRAGVQRFKECLASPTTDFKSATDVMFEFLEIQAKHPTQFKAFTELLCHVCEASLRHPACDGEEFMRRAAEFAADLALSAAGPEQRYPPREAHRRLRLEVHGKSLQDALLRAAELSKEPMRHRAVKLKALKCTQVPLLTFDGDVPEPDAAVVAPEVAAIPTVDSGVSAAPETSASLGPAYLFSLDPIPDAVPSLAPRPADDLLSAPTTLTEPVGPNDPVPPTS